VFNATFNNIAAISWRPALVVQEARVPGDNHRPWASNWYTLSLAAANRVHPFFLFTKPGLNPRPIGDILQQYVLGDALTGDKSSKYKHLLKKIMNDILE